MDLESREIDDTRRQAGMVHHRLSSFARAYVDNIQRANDYFSSGSGSEAVAEDYIDVPPPARPVTYDAKDHGEDPPAYDSVATPTADAPPAYNAT